MYIGTATEGVTTVENGLSRHRIHYLKNVDVRAGQQVKCMPKVPSEIAQAVVKSAILSFLLLCLQTCLYSIHIYILVFIFLDVYSQWYIVRE